MRRSPKTVTNRPVAGANARRMTANAEITAVAAVNETLKVRAKVGSAGAMNPYPSAMTTFADSRTQMPRGICLMAARGGRRGPAR